MTEDEAKTKWCPFARVKDITDHREARLGVANRMSDIDAAHADDQAGIEPGSHCIGSACMAWRWENADLTEQFVGEAEVDMWTRYGWRETTECNVHGHVKLLPPLLISGYCGLAGKP